ncbi:type IX secretion system protein PorD [Sphingobacterium pedocola]|uniref:DUF4835 domain-containing protein n=1 Tax=Sphingobacterium pedocola TaxID=2082722 RepID=A0ABR9T2B6_9SPHI|nr:DUF4835 family protein [Sphingobacterium pedocola]MBE8719478.1 DUF4835 domain-containing protein [Sphingobacterium pedocola]
MRQIYLSIILLTVSVSCIFAQELNARVELSAPQLQNTNARTLELLQRVVSDFLNNRSWTGKAIRPEERIDCSFNIIISEYDGSKQYKATAQINSARPVYGTNYNSPILSFRDKYFNFSYVEGEQLDFNENQDLGPLSSLLGFYANIIIGMDMDSFRKSGGTPIFSKARTIMNYSQSSQVEGWRGMEAMDNRYWLITNLVDRAYMPYREFSYAFHREGLDNMFENEAKAKGVMGEIMVRLKEVDRTNTGNVLTNALFTAKSNEFVGLFSKMPGNESVKIYNLLAELDPANISKYETLKK